MRDGKHDQKKEKKKGGKEEWETKYSKSTPTKEEMKNEEMFKDIREVRSKDWETKTGKKINRRKEWKSEGRNKKIEARKEPGEDRSDEGNEWLGIKGLMVAHGTQDGRMDKEGSRVSRWLQIPRDTSIYRTNDDKAVIAYKPPTND